MDLFSARGGSSSLPTSYCLWLAVCLCKHRLSGYQFKPRLHLLGLLWGCCTGIELDGRATSNSPLSVYIFYI